jgi:hypothetical protein
VNGPKKSTQFHLPIVTLKKVPSLEIRSNSNNAILNDGRDRMINFQFSELPQSKRMRETYVMSIHSPEESPNLPIPVENLKQRCKVSLANKSDVSPGDCQDVIHTPEETATITDLP